MKLLLLIFHCQFLKHSPSLVFPIKKQVKSVVFLMSVSKEEELAVKLLLVYVSFKKEKKLITLITNLISDK